MHKFSKLVSFYWCHKSVYCGNIRVSRHNILAFKTVVQKILLQRGFHYTREIMRTIICQTWKFDYKRNAKHVSACEKYQAV
jgi:hypothetical protein